jgi:hypothetical protein
MFFVKHADKSQVDRVAGRFSRSRSPSVRHVPGFPCVFHRKASLPGLYPGELEDDTHRDTPDEDEIEILRGDCVQDVKCAGHFFLRHGLPPLLQVVFSDRIPALFVTSGFPFRA